jgi:hypothetical protein
MAVLWDKETANNLAARAQRGDASAKQYVGGCIVKLISHIKQKRRWKNYCGAMWEEMRDEALYRALRAFYLWKPEGGSSLYSYLQLSITQSFARTSMRYSARLKKIAIIPLSRMGEFEIMDDLIDSLKKGKV